MIHNSLRGLTIEAFTFSVVSVIYVPFQLLKYPRHHLYVQLFFKSKCFGLSTEFPTDDVLNSMEILFQLLCR